MPALGDLSPIERLAAAAVLLAQGADAAVALSPLTGEVPEVADVEVIGTTVAGTSFCAVVAVLDCFDAVAETVLGYKGHIYLLGDEQIPRLLRFYYLDADGPSLMPTTALEILALCGLIYRFNVARKFGYPARGIMQLRLNGWGRHLSECFNLRAMPTSEALTSYLADAIYPRRDDYWRLISLCVSDKRPLDVEEIRGINRSLPFSVVT